MSHIHLTGWPPIAAGRNWPVVDVFRYSVCSTAPDTTGTEAKVATLPCPTAPAAEAGLSVPQTRYVTHPPLFRPLLPEITCPRHERQDAAIDD